MPIFEKPSRDSLPHCDERWTPIYLERGRLEVDDSSVKWIGADRTVFRVPIATVSALVLGPGTTVTHDAVKACAECNTPIVWAGEQGTRFYACGISPTHDNANAKKHAELYASRKSRTEVAKRIFYNGFRKKSSREKRSNSFADWRESASKRCTPRWTSAMECSGKVVITICRIGT